MKPSSVVHESVPLDELEDEICRLSAHLSAAMCRWLVLVAEFDRREGWACDGVRSCAHWLNWRCGLGMAAAHEHVRVARRLVELPAVRAAFGEGRLSYSKARALTRIATAASEAELVVLAAHTTAAQLERIARARRSVTRNEAEEANRRHESRHVHWFWDDDGSLVLTARLDPEEGALVVQALDAASHALRADAKAAATARSATDSSAEDTVLPATDSSAEDAGRSAADSSAEDTDLTSADSSAEDAARPATDSFAEDTARPATDSSAEDTVRSGPDSSAEDTVVPAADSSAQDAARSTTDSSAEDTVRSAPDSSAEDAARSAPDSSAEDADPRGPTEPLAEDRRAATRAASIEADRRPARRADALVAMAETMLASGPAARDGGDRYQAVVLVDAAVLAGGEGRCGLDDGPGLSADTALRVTCDASVVAMSLSGGGEPLNVGRATQSIPRAIRRALRVRDGGCRFPGCTQRRFVDGHHIVHWSRGGETSLANLVLLCRVHHRAVHEGGFGLSRTAAGDLAFTTPDGGVLHQAPPAEPVELDLEGLERHLGVVVTSATGACLWGGERLDLGLAVDGILGLEEAS